MRQTISAKFLLAALPGKRDAVVYPADVVIHHLPCKTAQGARKPRTMCLGGAKTTANVFQNADRRNIKGLASRGW